MTTSIPLDKDGKEAPIPDAGAQGGSGGNRGSGGFGGSRGSRRGGQRGGQRGGGRRGGFGRGRAPTQNHNFVVIAYNRDSGEEVWKTKVHSTVPHAGHHSTGTQASNSPITDGKRIYAYFGSHGIHCLDMSGEVKWSKQLGKMRTRNSFGEGSSPALHGDTLVINWDHEDDSSLVAQSREHTRLFVGVP